MGNKSTTVRKLFKTLDIRVGSFDAVAQIFYFADGCLMLQHPYVRHTPDGNEIAYTHAHFKGEAARQIGAVFSGSPPIVEWHGDPGHELTYHDFISTHTDIIFTD